MSSSSPEPRTRGRRSLRGCRRQGRHRGLPSSSGFASFLSLRDELELLPDRLDLLLDAFLLLRKVDDVGEASQVHGGAIRDPDEVGPVELLGFLAESRDLRAEDALARSPELLDE